MPIQDVMQVLVSFLTVGVSVSLGMLVGYEFGKQKAYQTVADYLKYNLDQQGMIPYRVLREGEEIELICVAPGLYKIHTKEKENG